MNRLQKKCFIASVGLHLFLVFIVVVGPAFISSPSKRSQITTIDFIPNNLIPDNFTGGGNPGSPPPPAAPPQRDVAPPAPKPEAKVEPRPEPPKETVKPPKETVETLEPKKETKRSTPDVTTVPVSRKSDSKKKPTETSKADSQAKAEADARRAAAALLGKTVGTLSGELSSSTKIESNPGPDGGGPAYAGYEMYLQKIYQGRYDQALASGGDISDAAATVEVSVTIQRDGTVTASRVVNPSGISGLDRLVKGVLGRVNAVRPFPEAMKDSQRTFNILFELKPKRGTG